MAITFKNAAQFVPGSKTIPGAKKKITMSVYVRVNSTGLGARTLFQRGNLVMTIYGADGMWSPAVRVVSTTTQGPLIPFGATYHFIFVYDEDDPSRRFFAVNGTKVMMPTGSPFPAYTDRTYYGHAAGGVDFTIEKAFYLDGYAASDADIEALAADSASAYSVFSAAAATPGVESMYHSCDGPIGSAVQATDPGVTWNGNPHYTMAASIPNPAVDAIEYADPLEYEPWVRIQRAYVGSSGRSVTVVMSEATGRFRITPGASTLLAAPTIRIDGGEPIALPTTPEAGLFSQVNADALFLALPPGVAVQPGQSVVLDAPEGWFPAAVGYSKAAVAQPVDNYAGTSVAKSLWPDEPLVRLGGNNEGPDREMVMWSAANVANYMAVGGYTGLTYWPDGTLKGDFTGLQIMAGGDENEADLPGIRGEEGLWVVRWDDHDPANPVTMSLSGSYSAHVVERPEYRNDGDSDGRGKVRVYSVLFRQPWPYTLASSIDATTTTIPFAAHLPGGFQSSAPPLYIEVGGEQIYVAKTNASLKRFENCTRGWNGTTAAAHATGSTLVTRYVQAYGAIRISSSSPDSANTHYANLAVYSPGGWEVPESPGAISLPPPDNTATNPRFKAYLEPGVGAFRYMSETPIQGSERDVEHPEHFTRPDDPHFEGRRVVVTYHIKEVRPFDLGSTPYAYLSSPFPSAERYEAVLGGPITTTPPSGTVETITIVNGRTTPVLHGQSLFGGGEVLRVVGVPLSGDEYQVERGAEGTTTTTHPAGRIEVGYRLPLAAITQIRPDDANWDHYYEAVLDENLSASPTFGADLYKRWDGDEDVNISARRPLTLTAPLSASGLVLTVAPASPDDWDVIAKNMRVTIGSERLIVTAADRAAGTITVASRSSGSAAYPTGTTATTSAVGFLIESDDGKIRGYNGLFTNYSSLFAIGVDRALVFTSDDGIGIKRATTAARVQQFVGAGARTKPYIYPSAKASYESTAKFTAAAPGCWHWLNVAFRATDAAIYAAAKAIRDNVPRDRKVVFEFGNELWNNAFIQTKVCYKIARLCGQPSHREVYLLRAKSAFEVVKRCFAETGRQDDLIFMICWQTAVEILADCRRLGVDPDGVAVAPYLSVIPTPTYGAVVNAIDDAQACDMFTFNLVHATGAGTLRRIGDVMKASLAAHEQVTGRRLLAAAYEGGLGRPLGTPQPYVHNPKERRARDVIKHPAFYYVQQSIQELMRPIGGLDLFMQFTLTGMPKTPDYWGMQQAQTSKPGRGDGRNGGVNNLDYSFMNPTDLLVGGGDGITESPRMQAWLDHQVAWREANTSGPGPKEPEPPHPDPQPELPTIYTARPRKFVASRFRSRFG